MRHRNERRQLRRKVGALSDKARTVRAELFACDAQLADVDRVAATGNDEMRDVGNSLRVRILNGIESYVDGLGLLVDVDDKMVSVAFQDDEPLHELIARHRWRGVETAAQAKDRLTDEVGHRSVGKSDLALLLSSVDQTAFLLYGTMPDVIEGLRGEEQVSGIVCALAAEDFSKSLMGDPRWVAMRERWVRFGWRGTTDATFNDTFIRAAAERVVEIHEEKGRGTAVRDTILDERVQRESRATRDQMVEAFRVRLEREYDALPRRSGATSEVDVTLDEGDAERLDRIADRWDTSRAGAIERIAREAVQDHLVKAAANPDATASRPVPYSDHELMRRGRELWEVSYAKGLTDEEVRAAVASLNTGSSFTDEASLFAAKWAVHAFQRLMTSHTFAAALMCSDVQKEALDGIEQQWDAFLVLVPNGMLVAGGLEFSRVMVATYSFGARMILMTTGGPAMSLHVAFAGTVLDEAPDLASLLVSDADDLNEDLATKRCVVMAKRLVAGLLLNLQDAGTHKVRKVDARPKSKGREAEPEHRIVTVGAPLEIDCRDAVKEYVEHGTRSSEKTGRRLRGTPTVQWMVRGHYRMQAHGPKHALRRKTWIRPHWQGHEAALIQTRAAKVSS